ncbi:hypothetical protein GCM10010400_27060 [Streptomyces aculeolatus]|uniref:DUF2637 domain-containing protein n=1 Tax=Streptomyces aculeolatus TaxID=270689 RepID=UPI001CED7DF5|nr:DUF2637 domain-containing protein [Streptomyces aculeolatus]
MTEAQLAATHSVPGSVAIRLSVAALGAIGFALSYDALRQMAVAVHIAGPLTYLFPLLIDGFIAIGVCALIILRTAPTRARLYVWALVGTATATSIWANALHAVRLNQLPNRQRGLQLGDLPVGLLSAVAPLALAGAVHLYIHIARHSRTAHPNETSAQHTADPDPPNATPSTRLVPSGQVNETTGAPIAADAGHPAQPALPASDQARQRRTGRPPGADLDRLLEIARNAVASQGKVSRSVVESAIRAEGLPLGGERLTEIMKVVRAEADTPSDHLVG